MESSWSQLEHRFDAWVSFSTVSSVDGPSPKSIFSRASPLASDSWRLTAASYSRLLAHIFRLSFDRAALASTASWFTLRFSVLPRFKVLTQSLINLSHAAAGLPDSKCLPQTLSFFSTFFHCDLSPKSTFLVSLCSVLQLLLLVYQQSKVSWRTLWPCLFCYYLNNLQ